MDPEVARRPGDGPALGFGLGMTERHRRFEELSASRFAVWGGVAGVMLSGLIVLIGQPSHWIHGAMVGGAVTVMSAATAGLSLPLARLAERKALRSGPGDT